MNYRIHFSYKTVEYLIFVFKMTYILILNIESKNIFQSFDIDDAISSNVFF